MVTIGLVGAGWWTQAVHAPAFKKAGARIAGVYAGQSARARSLAEAYGVPLFLEYGELLEEVDAVAIATPDTTHVPLALEAVRAGKHVFVEKPLGVNLEETRKLLREIEVRGLVGMTALTARADWGAETALAVVERIGEPLVFRGAFLADYLADPQAPVPWRGRLEGGGPAGVVGDLGAHLFDLVAWLMGGRLEAVFADTARFFPERENPDWAVVSARLGKARGGLELSRVHPVRPQRLFLEIEGTLGILRVEPAFWGPAEGARVFFSSRPGTWAPVPLDPGLLRGRDPKETFGVFHFHELARRFLRAVKTGEAPSPSLLEGVRAQAAIEAVLASAKQKNWQEVPYV